MAERAIEFGYNPPTGERVWEQVDPDHFVRNLHNVLDVASQHFSSFWVSDHLMIGEKYRLECWTQLVWIAARYPSQKIGTDVLSNSFRHPPLLAKMAASLQTFSRGRLILGYGAGWVPEEYEALGFDYPSARIRIAQMVDGIKVMRSLWTQNPASYAGEYYTVREAFSTPQPDPVPPILIGGEGERFLLRAVAEHADIWLPHTKKIDVLKHKISVLERHCHVVGRDISEIRVAHTIPVFLDTSRTAAWEWAGDRLSMPDPPFAGTPEELRDYLNQYIELGVTMFHMVFPGFPRTHDMELFADEVLPKLAL